MRLTKFNEVVLNEADIIAGLYSGNITSLESINIEDEAVIAQYNQSVEVNADHLSKLQLFVEDTCSLEIFDDRNQKTWLIPEKYKEFNIVSWLYNQCKTKEELNRVEEELELFVQHNMYEVLIALKYLVDLMRKNNVVWGLGRGSSVSSYCLYLIGVHKVDSLKYGIDIKEFLKGE